MKHVIWLVERETWHPKEEEALKQAFVDLGVKYRMCGSDFFERIDSADLSAFEKMLANRKDVDIPAYVCYGSLNWAKNAPLGVYSTIPNYACHVYYPKLGKMLLNHEYMMFPFADIISRQDRFFYNYGDAVFIRPDSGSKPFTGDVFHANLLEREIEKVREYADLDDHTMVLVAPFYKIIREWRFVVVNKKVVAGCIYKSDILADSLKCPSESQFTEAAKALAERAAEAYQPDVCFVVDICQTSEDYNLGDLSVLEINGFSTSALYDCDAKAVVAAVTKVAAG